MELSSSTLAAATPGTILRDKTIPGLHAKVSATGRRFFLYFRTKGGVERRPKLGEFPVMTVAQARVVAKEMLLEVAKGNDPMAMREIERGADTVTEAIGKYEKEDAAKRKTGAATAKLLRLHLGKAHGSDRIKDLTYSHMSALHGKMKATPVLANRILAYSSKLFSLAEKWEMRPKNSNPCHGIERYKEFKRKRRMTPLEAGTIAERLNHYKDKYPGPVTFIYLLILTGARKGEVAAARWEWLDGNVLRLPDSKTGEKPVYLPPQAMELINQLPRTSGTITGITWPYKLWYKVRAEAGCPDLRLHDLRRSFASVALDLGYSLAQIGELLGHASTQTTAGYAWMQSDIAEAAVARTATAIGQQLLRAPS
ncbi:integrase arm-type DNA-binding domain-containing protein [Dyella kyungheensis]|uniref:integrase arm-type DNA-binding domain-containing protein n=1 Tax=Dyella kyungheensis TaxID=1242174 RepID=UPI003CF3AC96